MLLAASALFLLVPAQTAPDAFLDARRKWANECLEGAKVHLDLAKLHHDAGRLELAEQLCEETRKRFGDEGFDSVFRQVFPVKRPPLATGDLADVLQEIQDNIQAKKMSAAKSTATLALKKWPKSFELTYLLGQIKDLMNQPADADFKKAGELAPTSATIQGGIAQRLLTKKQDFDGAFAAYLRTYFLDPHFTDSEPVAVRIREELGPKRGAQLCAKAKDAKELRAVLSLDSCWGTARALKNLGTEWQPELVPDVVRLLAHDSGDIRWAAMQLLRAKVDASFDPTLDQLLGDDDMRVRGMALHVAMARRGADAFPLAREFLASSCELLRYDAISALLNDGRGAAIEMVRIHGQTETCEALKKMAADRGR